MLTPKYAEILTKGQNNQNDTLLLGVFYLVGLGFSFSKRF